MSLTITTLRIADPETRRKLEQAIKAISSEFQGDWSVSIVDSPTNDSWQVLATGPDGIRRVRMLSGPFQHQPDKVQKTLREMTLPPGGREKVEIAIADLRDQGHIVDPRIHTDGKMWFDIDRQILASWQDMQDLADGRSLQDLKNNYVKVRQRTVDNLPPSLSSRVRVTPKSPFLTSLRLDGFLSFPPGSEPIQLHPLNVLIGPNGSGKSNLIEALELLHATPVAFANAINDGGGAAEWIWKGERGSGTASIDATVNGTNGTKGSLGIPQLRYRLNFTVSGQRTEVTDEAIEEVHKRRAAEDDVFFYYRFQQGHPVISVKEISNVSDIPGITGEFSSRIKRYLQRQDLRPDESVLSQRKDPDIYPELTWLGEQFEAIQIFRDWVFGRYALVRQPQPADLQNDFLIPDSRNISLILNQLEHSDAAEEFNSLLSRFLPRYQRFSTRVQGATVQFYLHEQGLKTPIPATRLSDGTIRFITILALLLSPGQRSLICIEEPELGLHPDALPILANLMVKTSRKTQLVVTTHSDSLVSALSECAESVLVCEDLGGTRVRRLDSEKLRFWLDKYRLGEIWRMGEIGGNP